MTAADCLPPEGGTEEALADLAASVSAEDVETADDSEQTLAMHAPVVAAVRLALLLIWIFAVVPFVAIPTALGRVGASRAIALFFWKGARRLLGIEIVRRGQPCAQRPMLVVANHASYLDIIILGSLVEAAFIAKKEVGQWPGIGLMSKIGRTVFIDRLPRHSKTQKNEMASRFTEASESLILFPEGTSNDGNRVLPFKSALLSVAEVRLKDGSPLPVQPVSIAYTHLDGLPMGRAWRAFFAWYGDMELAPHLWMVLGLGRLRVDVQFHEPKTLEAFASRKGLTDHCYRVVQAGVMRANAGLAPIGDDKA